jgi:hypothetical protein
VHKAARVGKVTDVLAKDKNTVLDAPLAMCRTTRNEQRSNTPANNISTPMKLMIAHTKH